MEKYFTADSYKNWERIGEPFTNSKGKLYTKVKCVCDRCVKGVYVSRIENGMPVPHPNANGVCFQCGGTGYLTDEVRLYTEKEYNAMTKRNEAAREKKQQEQEAKMKAEFADKKAQWLKENEFNEEEVTYIYFPADSYEVKESLKAAGFRYSPLLLWHRESNVGYEDTTIAVPFSMLGEFSAWGRGEFYSHAKDAVQGLIRGARPQVETEWAAAEKEKIVKVPVTLTKAHSFETRYGVTTAYTFVEGKHVYVWFTTKYLNYELGTQVLLSGTVKKLQEYDNQHQTVLTRCKVEENSEVM